MIITLLPPLTTATGFWAMGEGVATGANVGLLLNDVGGRPFVFVGNGVTLGNALGGVDGEKLVFEVGIDDFRVGIAVGVDVSTRTKTSNTSVLLGSLGETTSSFRSKLSTAFRMSTLFKVFNAAKEM